MRFRLRTLLIFLALGPPLLAGGWFISRALARHEMLTHAMFVVLIAAYIVVAAVCIAIILARIWGRDAEESQD